MRFNTRILLVCAGLALAVNARAQGTGRSLDIQPGARQNAMGASGVALAGDMDVKRAKARAVAAASKVKIEYRD